MSYGFRELADGILPELRRARLTINYETVGRSDEEIMAQLRNDASKLSVEELLYAAAKSQDAADKQQIYQTTTRLYPADVRAYNNLAAMAYAGGRYDEARQLLEKARGVSGGSAEVSSNLGLMALLQGDTQGAEALMAKGVQATNSAEALGNLHLAQGNYARAEQDFGDICSNSAALAQIQNKNYAKAARTLRGISRPDGMTDYLQAVLNARQGNREAAAAFLQAALQKDASLRPYAERDKEMDAIR